MGLCSGLPNLPAQWRDKASRSEVVAQAVITYCLALDPGGELRRVKDPRDGHRGRYELPDPDQEAADAVHAPARRPTGMGLAQPRPVDQSRRARLVGEDGFARPLLVDAYAEGGQDAD